VGGGGVTGLLGGAVFQHESFGTVTISIVTRKKY